jgi:hypothetical protein
MPSQTRLSATTGCIPRSDLARLKALRSLLVEAAQIAVRALWSQAGQRMLRELPLKPWASCFGEKTCWDCVGDASEIKSLGHPARSQANLKLQRKTDATYEVVETRIPA